MGPPQICILHRGAISSRKGNPNKLLQMCSGIVSSNKSVVLTLEASCIHDIMIPVHWRGWDGKQQYSHSRNNQHPWNLSRKSTISPRILLQLQMFWFTLYFVYLHLIKKTQKNKSHIWSVSHRTRAGQNYWHLFNIVGELSYVKRMTLVWNHLWQETGAGNEAITPEASSSVSVLHGGQKGEQRAVWGLENKN